MLDKNQNFKDQVFKQTLFEGKGIMMKGDKHQI